MMLRVVARLALFLAVAATAAAASAKDPNCARPEAWPAGMALTHLKNAGILDGQLDSAKTHVRVLASEKIGKDLYRQVHLVRFFKMSGEQVSAITVNEVSHQECSMSNVDVYLVSKRFGDYSADRPKPNR